MITIEASNINVGGSLNLLKDLADYLSRHNIPARIFVSYYEVYKQMCDLDLKGIVLIKTNIWSTILRYLKNRSRVLYFCSLPPFVRNNNSYVYFHAEYYADPLFEGLSQLSYYERIKKFFYYFILYWFNDNCSLFFCQTERIKKKLERTYGIKAEVRPFFKDLCQEYIGETNEKVIDFIYPALCSKHKNHINLLRAIKKIRPNIRFNIVLTIPDNAKDILEIVDSINKSYPNTIINIGVVSHSVIGDYYRKSKFLIFPSMMESLGLPLLEAIAFDLKVLASDKDYVHSAVDNPIVFNPESVDSIGYCMIEALAGKYDNINQSAKLIDSKEYILKCLISN